MHRNELKNLYGGLGIFEFDYIDLINYLKMINQSKKNTKLNIFKNYKLNKQKIYKNLNKIQIY